MTAAAVKPAAAAAKPAVATTPASHHEWRPLAIYAAARLWMLAALVGLIAGHHTTLSRALTSWDGAWYLRLAEHGYPHAIPTVAGRATQSTLGFFPLFPLTMRGLHALTGAPYLMSAAVVVTVSGATFALVLWWLMRHLFDERIADRATALVCFFPGFFVFAMTYSEPLSLALSVVCLYALTRRWWWLGGISAALASATRSNAIVLVACCAWAAAVAISKRRQWSALAAPALAPLGLVVHFVFLYFRTGNFWAYEISQEQAWRLRFRPSTPLHLVGEFVTHPFAQDVALQVIGSVFIVVCAAILARSHYPGAVVVYGVGLATLDLFVVPAPRFVLSAFPLVAVVGHRLRGRWFALTLAGSSIALAALVVQTVLGKTAP